MTDNPLYTDAQLSAGRRLLKGPCDFMLSVVALENLPDSELPEVAFAGRSNVGKSSLINALTERKGLARASNTPGRTRELNFFNLNDQLRLVDLPGYGYARASKSDIARWTQLTRQYLRGRPSLRRVFTLIDSRHGLKDNDLEILSMFDETAVVYQIVLTKADKIKKGQQQGVLAETQDKIAKRPAAHPTVLLTSSEKRQGLDELRAEIAALAIG